MYIIVIGSQAKPSSEVESSWKTECQRYKVEDKQDMKQI